MALPDVRRLAAVDMWGTAGSRRRRRLIRAEFVVGSLGCVLLGSLALASSANGVWLLIGVWLVGAGVNYIPLALYAQVLSRRAHSSPEMRDTDLRRELRRAGVQQLWIAVPCAVAIAALAQERRRAR